MARKLCIHPQKLENEEGQKIPIKYRLRFVQSLMLESLNRSITMSLCDMNMLLWCYVENEKKG